MKFFEDNFPDWLSGVNFKKTVTFTGGSTFAGGNFTLNAGSNLIANGNGNYIDSQIETHNTVAAINATGTATATQVATGYITSTSASATTITLPTGTLLGAALSAVQGTVFDLYVDNTAGANTVTIAVAVNGILSAAAVAGSAAGAGLLTVPSGVTGLACFRLTFSSATAYVFSRIA